MKKLRSLIIFSTEGRYLRQWGYYGQGAGEFNQPAGVCCVSSPGKQDEIAVADTRNHRVQFFTPEGKFIRQWGRQGLDKKEFVFPLGIAALRGEIIVTDTGSHRIQAFTSKGKFLRQWERPRNYELYGREFHQATEVALLTLPGRQYRVVVTDAFFQVQIFTLEEEHPRYQWGWKGLILPRGVTISPSGEIAMNVVGGEQIQIVGVHLR